MITATNSDRETYQHDGILESVKSFGATAVSILKTRIEILSTELQEERERVKDYVVLGVISLFCLMMGVVFLSFFVVVLFWDVSRVLVSGIVTLLYFGAAALIAVRLKGKLKSHPRMFATTIAELAKDYRHLTR